MFDGQDVLFPVPKAVPQAGCQLSSRSTLAEASAEFERHMQQQFLSENTIKAFRYDLNILSDYLGKQRAIGEIALNDLEHFVHWLQHERGVPCNVKSLARRITTLKVFFGWLAESAVLLADPAAALIQVQFTTPLPDILYDGQVEQLVAAAQVLRQAARPDARPHLLVSLLLATGIKKGECMAIVLNHLDLSEQPAAVWIRYANPRYRLKERKLKLDPAWPGVLEEYKAQYAVADKLFPCTARNLEYVLADVGQLAQLDRPVSFEALRWTCAARDYKAGMAADELRRKLGLSEITWRQAAVKLAKLAAPAL
ncbi:MAG: site-specific integrase [Thermoflexales bacterium]|nr:site-specific integrase [Thermoflexales bacterium]